MGDIGAWGQLVEAANAFAPKSGGCSGEPLLKFDGMVRQTSTVSWGGTASCSVTGAELQYGVRDGSSLVVHGRARAVLWPQGRWRVSLPGFKPMLRAPVTSFV